MEWQADEDLAVLSRAAITPNVCRITSLLTMFKCSGVIFLNSVAEIRAAGNLMN